MNIRAIIQKIKSSFNHHAEEVPNEAVLGFLRVLVFPDKKEMTFWFGDPND